MGHLRPDVVLDDLVLMLMANGGLIGTQQCAAEAGGGDHRTMGR